MAESSLWALLQERRPSIHAISNLVTATDCANLLLAVGAKPIMAQAPQEAADISALCKATVLNLGTPDDDKFLACERAGHRANELGHPVIIDPVGIGASPYRLRHMEHLLTQVKPDILRANLGEVQALLGRTGQEQGVDSAIARDRGEYAPVIALARELKCTVLLTGQEDLITDGERSITLAGGDIRVRRITGAGCMLSCLCAAMATLTDPFTAALTASDGWKRCAAYAGRQVGPVGQMGAFHMALMDAACVLADLPEACEKTEWK